MKYPLSMKSRRKIYPKESMIKISRRLPGAPEKGQRVQCLECEYNKQNELADIEH